MEQQDKMIMRPTQAETSYVTVSTKRGTACANCRWFSKDDGGYCHLIENYPAEILPTGYCERHEALPDAEPVEVEPVPVVIVEAEGMMEASTGGLIEQPKKLIDVGEPGPELIVPKGKGFINKAVEFVTSKLTLGSKAPALPGFEVQGNRWVAWWSNNLEDREGEFFPAKAIDEYIARVDMGIVPMPELWDWHIPGTRHGQADVLFRHGHFVVAGGTFDDTPQAKAAMKDYQKHPHKYAVSHGFKYNPDKFTENAYWQFNTFEISPLPVGKEANPYTKFEEVAPVLTDEKKAYLREKYGAEIADSLIAKTEEANKAVEELGVAYKDFTPVTDNPAAVAVEAVKGAEQSLMELVGAVIEDNVFVTKSVTEALQALTTEREARAALQSTLTEQAQQIKALQDELKLSPRAASSAVETALSDEEAETVKSSIPREVDSFWSA